jgi:hypothetical protein
LVSFLSVALFTCSPEEPAGDWIRAVQVAIPGGLRVRNGDIKKRAAFDEVLVANPTDKEVRILQRCSGAVS